MSYEEAVLAVDPDQYWPLISGGDAAAGPLDGTLYGPVPAGAVVLQDKPTNPSLHFDGVDDYIAIPPGTLDYTAAFSVMAWVRPASVTPYNSAIVRKRDNWWLSADVYRGFSIAFFDEVADVVKFCSSNNFTNPYKYEVGNAYLVVGTYNGSRLRIYVNGILSDELACPGTTPRVFPTYDMRIGCKIAAPQTEFFNGDISHVATWGRELTQAEVTGLYEAGWFTTDAEYRTGLFFCGINEPPLVSDYDFWASKLSYVFHQCWRETERDAWHAANPDVKVLAYKNFGSMPDSRHPVTGQIAAGVDYLEADVAHPDWFLHYAHTNPDDPEAIAGNRITYYAYPWVYPADPRKAGYIELWADNVIEDLAGKGWDGVFVDNFDLAMHYNFDETNCAEFPPGPDQLYTWQASMLKCVQYLRPRLQDAGLEFIANFGAGTQYWTMTQSWLEFCDGWMDEYMGKYDFDSATHGYDYDGEHERSMLLATLTQQMGRTYIGSLAAPRRDEAAATYMIGSNLSMQRGRAFTMKHHTYADPQWFPIYDRALTLGEPVADRYQPDPANEYLHARDFAQGKVIVNASDEPGSSPMTLDRDLYNGLRLLSEGVIYVAKKTALVLTDAPFGAEPGETLIPSDDLLDARIDAAVSSATADDDVDEDAPLPFGMSWGFDFEAGRFQHDGADAPRVHGEDALIMWCLMAVNSTRFSHSVFTEAFGIESLDDLIGSTVAAELANEFEARLRDTLTVHDRVVDIEDVEVSYDPTSDAVVIDQFTVVTDEDDRVLVPVGGAS